MDRRRIHEPERYQRMLDLNPMGRFGKPEEVANAALFLFERGGELHFRHEPGRRWRGQRASRTTGDPMFMLNDMPEQVSGELLDLLVQCRTETIGHHRHWGFVRGNIRSVLPGRRIVGTAVTVALPGHDLGVLSHALSLLREGDILCIDRLGDTHNTCWAAGPRSRQSSPVRRAS